MKTFECIAHNGKNGKEIAILVRAVGASQAKMDAIVLARQQFGPGHGAVTIIGCREIK